MNIKDPANLAVLGTIATTGPALGVDFDLGSSLAAIAMGTAGLQLDDISNPAAPKLRGLLAGGNVRRVLLRLPAALLADAQRSVTSVNVSNPDQPVLSASLTSDLGGIPLDIAAYGSTAITADNKFGKATPIVNISDPLRPNSVGFWNWQSNPGYGSGIALDQAYAYRVLSSNSYLRILQYQNITDPFGIAPKVQITSPTNGTTLIQGQTVTFSANATDDVAVASVSFLIDGISVFNTSAVPYQLQYTIPSTATMLMFSATATDFGNNVGAAPNVQVNVIPDPLTTVTGKTVDTNGNTVSGAAVTVLTATANSTANGSFSFPGLPTIKGNLVAQAIATVNGVKLFAQSAATTPVVGGVTNVGTLVLAPAPIITSVTPRASLAGATVAGLKITGYNLLGSTFTFVPAGLTASSVIIDPSGTSATLNVAIPSTALGRYVLTAANPAGSSTAIGNYLVIELVVPGSSGTADADGDGLTNAQEIALGADPLNADTDRDGYPDSLEVALKTDPLNANSFPSSFMLYNSGQLQVAFSLLNQASPFLTNSTLQQISQTFSLLNLSSPYETNPAQQQVTSVFSLLNLTSPIGQSPQFLQSVFSLLNGQSTNAVTTESLLSAPATVESAASQTAATSSTTSSVTVSLQRIALSLWTETRSHIDASVDTNHNGLPDEFERWIYGTATFANPDDDPDNDGITNLQEWAKGTNPLDPDTDHDGVPDGTEIRIGTNPLNGDTDGDGWIDGDEVASHSDPLNFHSVPKMPPTPADYFLSPVISVQNFGPGLAQARPESIKPGLSKGESSNENTFGSHTAVVGPSLERAKRF